VLALLLALLLLATTLTGCFDASTLGASNGDGTEGVTTDDATTGGDPDGTTAGEETTDEGESTEPLPELELPSEALLKEIQSDYFEKIKILDGTDRKDIRVVVLYHGVYNELAVVSMCVYSDSDDHQGFSYFYDDEIGGHTFSMSSEETLYTWKNGVFTKLKDAYEQKLLTQDQIGIIAKIHNAESYIMYQN